MLRKAKVQMEQCLNSIKYSKKIGKTKDDGRSSSSKTENVEDLELVRSDREIHGLLQNI